jgi:hypothetical protein
MGMHQIYTEENQRREYSRVEAYLPFEFRVIAQEEKEHIWAKIPGDSTVTEFRPIPDMGDYDHIIGEWMKILNSKLDTVIRLITLQHEGYFGLPFKAVSISGGGMSFSLPQAIPLGEILEIKILLNLLQPIALCIYGEVVNTEQRNDGHLIAVQYIQMDNFIRDEIIRFVFEREREIIRERKR